MIGYTVYLFNQVLYSYAEQYNAGLTAATLTMEINQPSTFHFDMLPSHPESDILASNQSGRALIAVRQDYVNDDEEVVDSYYPFLGRVKNVTRDMYGKLSVDCEDCFSFLNDSYVRYSEGLYPTVNDMLVAVIDHYNTQLNTAASGYVFNYDQNASVGTDTAFLLSKDYDENEKKELEFYKSGDFIADKLTDQYSSILLFKYDYDPINIVTNIRFAWIKDFNPGLSYTSKVEIQNNTEDTENTGEGEGSSENTQEEFEPFPTPEHLVLMERSYGFYPSFSIEDNIIDISKDTVKTSTWSGIIPVGKDGLTLNSAVWNDDLVEKYGYKVKVVEFSEIDDAQYLEQVAVEYIERFSIDYGYKFSITAIEPCEAIKTVNYLTRVGYITAVKDIDNSLWITPCLSIKLNLFDLESNEYVLGPYVPQSVLNEDVTAI